LDGGSMIALTQEKREELIFFATNMIENSDPNYFTVKLAKIALASLTAEPECWSIVDRIFSTKVEALAPGFIGEPEPLFSFPPVPEITFPAYKRNGKPLNILAELVWVECIEETKRLNGLGE